MTANQALNELDRFPAFRAELVNALEFASELATNPSKLVYAGEILIKMQRLGSMIQRAAADPNTDVDKMERLGAMYERMQAKRAKAEFTSALAEFEDAREANAAFIVTACNEYDSLKAQNTELVAALQLIEGTKGADAERVMREYARAALAKVTP